MEKVTLLGTLIAEVYTEGVIHSVGRKHRVVALLILVAVVIATRCDIAEHGRTRRMTTSTTTKHKLLVVEETLDNHTVELILDTIDILIARDELWNDAHNESVIEFLDVSHKFYATILLACETDIRVVHRRDTVGEELVRRDVYTEGVDGDDNQFVERVPSVDIERWIALCKAQILRKLKRSIVTHMLVENLRKDEV